MKKRLISWILTVCMLLGMAPTFHVTAGAVDNEEPIETQGSCGEGATWVFDESTGTLTISGTGDIADYTGEFGSYGPPAPWGGWYDKIKRIEISPGITAIGNYAFGSHDLFGSYFNKIYSNLTYVSIPDTVVRIGQYAFAVCTGLEQLTIPDNVQEIGEYAFFNCTSLKSINLPSQITKIDEGTFENCGSLENIQIPKSVTDISNNAFMNCKNLQSAELSSGLKSLGDSAFKNTDLGQISLPEALSKIGEEAFYGCSKLKQIIIPDAVTQIGNSTFESCISLEDVVFPSQLTEIGSSAFSGCTAIKQIKLPDQVKSIDTLAFSNCTALESISIPKGIEEMGNRVFDDCTSLTEIHYAGSIEDWNAITFGNTNDWLQKINIYCTDGTIVNTGGDIEEPEDQQPPIAMITLHRPLIEAGSDITLSGTESSDNVAIASYEWNFGDGTSDSGETVTHRYSAPGTYEITLTVVDQAENKAQTSAFVTVVDVLDENTAYTKLAMTILDAYTGEPIENASVMIESESFSTNDTTNALGQVDRIVPNGAYTVSAVAEGYVARTVSITAEGGIAEHTLGLSTGSLMGGKISVTELTDYDEILAAGIDPNAEGNQHVYKFATVLTFMAGLTTYEFPLESFFNMDMKFIKTNGGGFQKLDPDLEQYPDGINIGIFPCEHFVLVIYGETHWLKEIYNVELMVYNMSSTDQLNDITATLELPEGLSLAEMSGAAQSATAYLGNLPEANIEHGNETLPTVSTNWYVRGDTAGEYNISARVHAIAEPYHQEIEQLYTTISPVKVYAGEQLELTVIADDMAVRGEEYPVTLRLENVSDKPIYNLEFGITGAEQYKVIGFGEGEIKLPITDTEFGEEWSTTVDVLRPGATVELELVSTIWFNSIFELIELTKVGSYVDVGYYLTNIAVIGLEGSTTDIPFTVQVNRSPRDNLLDFVTDNVFKKVFKDILPSGILENSIVEVLGPTTKPMITTAKSILKLSQGGTNYTLYARLPDATSDENVLTNKVISMYSADGAQKISDTINGREINVNDELVIEAVNSGEARVYLGYKDEEGNIIREWSYDFQVQDEAVSQEMEVFPDEEGIFHVSEAAWEALVEDQRAKQTNILKKNPLQSFESDMTLHIDEEPEDFGYDVEMSEQTLRSVLTRTGTTHLKIDGNAADLQFNRDAITSIAEQADGELTLSAHQTGGSRFSMTVSDEPVYQFSIQAADGSAISNLGAGKVNIRVPYELADPADASGVYVEHIYEDGTIEKLDATYDPSTQSVEFATNSFSYFRIMVDEDKGPSTTPGGAVIRAVPAAMAPNLMTISRRSTETLSQLRKTKSRSLTKPEILFYPAAVKL